MTKLKYHSNPDLTVTMGNKAQWNQPEFRRSGFHNLHRNNRYELCFRADRVLDLNSQHVDSIASREDVNSMISNPAFSGMVIMQEQNVLYEAYADDFSSDNPHSIQSITKLFVNLMVGQLWQSGDLELDQTISYYLPEIGSGYADATVQDVLDMNVVNDYSEDYNDPFASSYGHEPTIGWRLDVMKSETDSQLDFLCRIASDDIVNKSGHVNYKSANTDVLGYIIERVSAKPLRQWVLEIVEGCGIEHAFHCSTDRFGFPVVDGGGCMSLRDLGRFGLLFARRGTGVNDKQIGSANFIEHTVKRARLPFEPPRDEIMYSNQAFTNGKWIGHSGYGGQFLLVNLETGVVGAFLSVLENDSAFDIQHTVKMINMLEGISNCQ